MIPGQALKLVTALSLSPTSDLLDFFQDMTPIHQHIILYTIEEYARETFESFSNDPNLSRPSSSKWPNVCYLDYVTANSQMLSWEAKMGYFESRARDMLTLCRSSLEFLSL